MEINYFLKLGLAFYRAIRSVGVRENSRFCLGSDAWEAFDSALQWTHCYYSVRLSVGASLLVYPCKASLIFLSLPSSTTQFSLLGISLVSRTCRNSFFSEYSLGVGISAHFKCGEAQNRHEQQLDRSGIRVL